MSDVRVIIGDCREELAKLPSESVHCCVTSPPYFGLRSYLPDTVRLKASLSSEDRSRILAELTAIGVFPIDYFFGIIQ